MAVIFCTGSFAAFPPFSSSCRFIQSQPALEHAVSMLVRSGQKIGVIVPSLRLIDDHGLGLAEYQRDISWLDPSNESDWERVAALSADCEALVLDSVDYGEDEAARLRRETGMPVILPRRVLASAVRLVFDVDQVGAPHETEQDVLAAGITRLTQREREVMWLMVEGMQSKQIAHQLSISSRTVSIHRANVLAKLAVSNTHALTRMMLGR